MNQRICEAQDCTRSDIVGNHWCGKHWQRWLHNGSVERPTRSAACTVDGCPEPYHARNLCERHYYRWKKHGDPLVVLRPRAGAPVEERFWPKVDKNGPVPDYAPHLGQCWLWTGARTAQGYGRLTVGGREGRTRAAHRVAYELLIGPIPEGLTLDHLCCVRLCVRSEHLEPVTLRENIRRGHLGKNGRGRTRKVPIPEFCPDGHDLKTQRLKVKVVWECRCCGREYGQDHFLPPLRSAQQPGTTPLT